MIIKQHLRTFPLALITVILTSSVLQAQSGPDHGTKFEQLGYLLTPPNAMRGVDGSPGPEYWQQRADYTIDCTLDTRQNRLDGEELITYYNQSPHTLHYLWLQLDENQHSPENDNQYFNTSSIQPVMSENAMRNLDIHTEKEKYGCKVEWVRTDKGEPLAFSINQTMMRVELPKALKPGEVFRFRVKWHYYLVNRVDLMGLMTQTSATNLARGGYEHFPDNDNYLYTITQWYPRMCVFSDIEGWQTNQFTGRGEFALNFGNFLVKMTLPDDYIVGATGTCLNYKEVLAPDHLARWKQAQQADDIIEIVTLDEARKNEKKTPSKRVQTWIYQADNVRDFAWTASRKFVWDALPYTTTEGNQVMCMSYYSKESYPLFRRYSTKAIRHTLETYGRYAIPYPYPVAISVDGESGMEYPMICFNNGRTEPDGTYTEATKNGCISVIIHEVGHNFFPMIINSDERQWAWMDEGLNSFVQFLAESSWDNNYPHWFGPAQGITGYMRMPKHMLEPIMTNSENIEHYLQNAYQKPAAALNILRETIMGREAFDYAFKAFCEQWAFRHPAPADFFRAMEEASGVDLDWFWRGWFFTTDAVDIALDSIRYYRVDLESDPEPGEHVQTMHPGMPADNISRSRNREEGMKFLVDEDSSLQDFYYQNPYWEAADSSFEVRTRLYGETFEEKEKEGRFGNKHYYELHFSNKGGLVMPVILEWTYADGSKEIERIPVQIWRLNENNFTKVFVKDKKVTGIVVDPLRETADIDITNNTWPVKEVPSKFQVFKRHLQEDSPNPMQKARKGRS